MSSRTTASLQLGDHLVVLDGYVVELFVEGVNETTRLHARFLSVHDRGRDRKDRWRLDFAPGPDATNGFRLEVPPEREGEARAFLDAVAEAKRRCAGPGR